MVEELYRHRIETSKVTYWIAAHDLVSRYVPPNLGSQWRQEERVFSDEAAARLDRPGARR